MVADAELIALDGAALARGYAKKNLSPVEVTRACLAQIDRLDARFGGYVLVDHERALQAARASEDRWNRGASLGPLDGVPGSIKDIALVEGWPTWRGSRTRDDARAETVDAPSVRHLRAAGMVMLGKTSTPEFGWKAVTDNPRGDLARNPFDPTRTAGGSSGGAVVAAALGMGVMHLGSDGGGSIRIPSSFSGVAGLKPTFGRVPAWPPSPFGTVSHFGPICRTVGDCALMLDVIARPDLRDWHVVPREAGSFARDLDAGVRGLRIAASPTLAFVDVDEEVRARFDAAVATFTELGAKVHFVDPPIGRPRALFETFWYGAAANLVASVAPERRDRLEPALRSVAAEGEGFDGRRIRAAMLERDALGSAMQCWFDGFDLLLTPATAIPAFEAGHEVPPASSMTRWLDWAAFSWPFNLTQQPAMSVPCGRTAEGLPVGLQIVGAKFADATVLRAARAFERARPWSYDDVVVAASDGREKPQA
ncbi:MAG: amidase [Geminicoccaceae bacterium]|nr:amidase [Geminicoccaceae bacterium]